MKHIGSYLDLQKVKYILTHEKIFPIIYFFLHMAVSCSTSLIIMYFQTGAKFDEVLEKA